MIPVPIKDPYYEKALAEHHDLCRLVGAIEEKLNTTEQVGPAVWAELPAAFEQLLMHMTRHFAEEVEGGLLEEAACRLPRLGPQTLALERQHPPLLKQLREIVEQSHLCGESEARWRALNVDFRNFCKALMTHEAAENQIAEEAFKGEIV